MGTPEFAVPSLKRIIEKYNVSAVFTQPDRPKGRGNKVSMSPVKEEALRHNIPVYQPVKIKDHSESIKLLKELNPDFIIVVAFGQILPKKILDIPKMCCINLHASLLPKYRGAAPINWAIINGEAKSGNTTMLMDAGLDTGDMLLKSETSITDNMTFGELHDILMNDGADLLVDTIERFSKGDIIPQKQDNEKSCYASKVTKETGKINWNLSSKQIHNSIKGLNPWPAAYTEYENKIMKIYEAETLNLKTKAEPGYIIRVNKAGIEVAAGDGILLIKTIQFPGGKPLKVEEYIKGHTILEGVVLV
jgi:methionyl-tRNA formyltransferase